MTLLVVEVVTRIEYSLETHKTFRNFKLCAYAFYAHKEVSLYSYALKYLNQVFFLLYRRLKVGNLTIIKAYMAYIIALLVHKHVLAFCARLKHSEYSYARTYFHRALQ